MATRRRKTDDNVSKRGIEYLNMDPLQQVCRDCYGGNETIKKRGEKYLPKNIVEGSDAYARRLDRVHFYNMFGQTVDGLTGMVFRSDPERKDFSERLKQDEENIDLCGNSIDDFAMQVFIDAYINGQTYIFVDFSRADNIKTLADENRSGVRPYFVHVRAENLISWRYENKGGQFVLTQIVIREQINEADGDFSEREITRYRVVRPDNWEIWTPRRDRQGKIDNEEFEITEKGTFSIGKITLATVNFNKRSFMVSRPPLYDLALENIGHYQVRSDHRSSLHFSSISVLTLYGRGEQAGKPIDWDADSVLDLPSTGKAEFLEHKGHALAATRDELKDQEERIARMGLGMIAEGDVDIKATKLMIDSEQVESKQMKNAKELDRAMNEAIGFFAEWVGKDAKTFGTWISNKSFRDTTMNAEMINTWSKLVSSGQITLETMWRALEKGNVLPEDFDPDKEALELEKSSDFGDDENDENDEEEENEQGEEENENPPGSREGTGGGEEGGN